MLAIWIQFCSCLCIVCRNVSEALMLAIWIQFCSCRCKVCSRVSEALLLDLRTLSLSFITNNFSEAFVRFIAFSGSPTAVLSFSSMRRHGHSDKLTHYGITLWAYLSEPLVKDNHKCLSLMDKTTIPRAPSYVITHYRYVHVTERYTETLHVKKMADLVAVSLFNASNF